MRGKSPGLQQPDSCAVWLRDARLRGVKTSSHWRTRLAFALAGLCPLAAASAAGTTRLPDAACDPAAIFAAGFDEGEGAVPDPSGGSGGEVGGNLAETVAVGDTIRPYLVRVPPDYEARRPTPVIVLLHGAAGPNTAMTSAYAVRELWAATADATGAILVAPVGSGDNGSWVPGTDTAAIDAALDQIKARYDIDRNRIHLWGYSAGGHLAHGVALDNSNFFAAYAVNAGVLAGYAGTDAPRLATRKLPYASYIGLEDYLLLPYAREDEVNFRANGWGEDDAHVYVEFVGGHEFPSKAQIAEIWEFLCPYALRP